MMAYAVHVPKAEQETVEESIVHVPLQPRSQGLLFSLFTKWRTLESLEAEFMIIINSFHDYHQSHARLSLGGQQSLYRIQYRQAD